MKHSVVAYLAFAGAALSSCQNGKMSASVIVNASGFSFDKKTPKLVLNGDSLACTIELTEKEQSQYKDVSTKFYFYNNAFPDVPKISDSKVGAFTHDIALIEVESRTESITDALPGDVFTCKVEASLDGVSQSSFLSNEVEIETIVPTQQNTLSAEYICQGKTLGDVVGTAVCLSSPSSPPTADKICDNNTIDGVEGSAVCQSGIATGADPVASEIASGKSAWKSDGTVVNGTMANRGTLSLATSFPGAGYFSGISATPDGSTICTSTSILGVSGTAVCQSTSGGTNTTASQVLTGTYFWNSSGVSTQGTMANRGTWNLTGVLSAFPGTGYYSGVASLPTANSICDGTTIVGVDGSAVCQSGTATGSNPVAGEILSGKSAWNASGAVVNGTMENRGVLSISASFPGAGYYSSLSSAPTDTTICTSTSILGVNGSAVCQSASGGTNATASQVLTGTYFWNSSGTSVQGTMSNRGTWDMTTAFPGSGYFGGVSNAPVASDLCDGVFVNGVEGTSNCAPVLTAPDLLASAIHRDKGGTPTQLTIAGEKAAANTLASGYREIPDVLKDDDGIGDLSSVTIVTRGTTVWNGAVPRNACGMGLATVAARIADCDTQHSTKPSWDAAAGDGRLSWSGAQNGNGSEGSWTLVSVYDASLTNGTVCASNCREVWRDDTTGLLWSDRLGDLTTNRNQGFFSWCTAVGNTQNQGSLDCTPGTSLSYNKSSISLCAEAAGLTTPAGGHDSTANNDIGTWNSTGTTIRDAKAGMMQTANSDPVGSAQSPSVRWRVPTRADWLVADVNGLYRVLPNAGFAYWSATTTASTRANAWYINLTYGHQGSNVPRSSALAVRCVGR